MKFGNQSLANQVQTNFFWKPLVVIIHRQKSLDDPPSLQLSNLSMSKGWFPEKSSCSFGFCPSEGHMGQEHASRDKKLPMVNFLIFGQMNIYKRIQEDENPPIKGF